MSNTMGTMTQPKDVKSTPDVENIKSIIHISSLSQVNTLMTPCSGTWDHPTSLAKDEHQILIAPSSFLGSTNHLSNLPPTTAGPNCLPTPTGNTDQPPCPGQPMPTPQDPEPTNSVVNLSKVQLTESMISLLSKGLNFCPTPDEPDLHLLKQDLDAFHTSLRRSLFFNRRVDSNTSLDLSTMSQNLDTTHHDDSGPFDHYLFKNPSKWSPKGPIQLESMITINTNQLSQVTPRAPRQQNLTKEERQAMAELRLNREIVIKPADKGSAVVIQNRDDYIQEGLRQLMDQNFYLDVPEDLTPKHNEKIKQLIDTMLADEEITDRCAKYLHIEKPRTSQLYLLPKIHENKFPVPGRPIVSANNSPTEKISQLADFFLQPLVATTRSYVKDTTDFIIKIEQISGLKEDTILCTIDVSSLYTNIPNQEGIEACNKFLSTTRDTQPTQATTASCDY
jgi:hypothetical protein